MKQKFSIDIEQITIGELIDAEKDAGVMLGLLSRCLADDMGTLISEEAATKILRSKSVREYNALQLSFLASLQLAQKTALTSETGQPDTR